MPVNILSIHNTLYKKYTPRTGQVSNIILECVQVSL